MLEQIQKVLNLSSYEINELSSFDAAVLKKAWQRLQGKGDIANKFRYLLKACQGIQQDWKFQQGSNTANVSHQNKPTPQRNINHSPQVKNKRVFTAIEMANEIRNFMDEKTITDFAKLVGKEAAEKYRDRCLGNFIYDDYVITSENGEEAAMAYITSYRNKIKIL